MSAGVILSVLAWKAGVAVPLVSELHHVLASSNQRPEEKQWRSAEGSHVWTDSEADV